VGGYFKVPNCVIAEPDVESVAMARLFRIIVPVDDIERAALFYGSLLEQAGIRVSRGRHYFDCGGVVLACFSPRADGDEWDPTPNPDHLYLAVDDLEAVYARAERLGGLATQIGDGNLPMGEISRRPWGERSFYLRDPFGNKLCFVDEKTVFRGPPPA
jgi:catechol 2,3-dioxygenase-like lactoylglutathione lyase family enzyme